MWRLPYIFNCSWNQTSLRIRLSSSQCECLATASLSIRKNSRVESVEYILNVRLQTREHMRVARRSIKYAFKTIKCSSFELLSSSTLSSELNGCFCSSVILNLFFFFDKLVGCICCLCCLDPMLAVAC